MSLNDALISSKYFRVFLMPNIIMLYSINDQEWFLLRKITLATDVDPKAFESIGGRAFQELTHYAGNTGPADLFEFRRRLVRGFRCIFLVICALYFFSLYSNDNVLSRYDLMRSMLEKDKKIFNYLSSSCSNPTIAI